jgi:hypothetical protein
MVRTCEHRRAGTIVSTMLSCVRREPFGLRVGAKNCQISRKPGRTGSVHAAFVLRNAQHRLRSHRCGRSILRIARNRRRGPKIDPRLFALRATRPRHHPAGEAASAGQRAAQQRTRTRRPANRTRLPERSCRAHRRCLQQQDIRRLARAPATGSRAYSAVVTSLSRPGPMRRQVRGRRPAASSAFRASPIRNGYSPPMRAP